MWSRKELKERAKGRIKLNYWKAVLAALVLTVIAGGSSGGAGGAAQEFFSRDEDSYMGTELTIHGGDIYEEDGSWSDMEDELDHLDTFDTIMIASITVMILVICVVVALVIVLPVQILILNPLEVGINRFFLRNLRDKAQVKEVCFSFDNGYLNAVKTIFFRDLYTFLWSLLLVIPGIIKAYEYQMIPYILAENPDMDSKAAFALSKEMMMGNKWKAFVLDLSFLGWYILNGITLGILGIFYLNPYKAQTNAALYQAIKEEHKIV